MDMVLLQTDSNGQKPHILEFGSNQTAARTITVAEGFV